MNVMLCWV